MTRFILSAVAGLAICGLAHSDSQGAQPLGFACGTRSNSSLPAAYSTYGPLTAASYRDDYRYGSYGNYGSYGISKDPYCNSSNGSSAWDYRYPTSRAANDWRSTQRYYDWNDSSSSSWTDHSRGDSRWSDHLPQSRYRNAYDDWRYDSNHYDRSPRYRY